MPLAGNDRKSDISASAKLERFKESPENGPKVLFFSGGTALRGLSRRLIAYTYNSIHIITPFDSGGSSAVLRKAFEMLAVGDLRNRLMALADLSIAGNREIFALFTYRLSRKDSPQELCTELGRLAAGEHVLIDLVPEPKRKVIRAHFQTFLDVMPKGFDLRGASIGNIILAAGYMTNDNRIESVLTSFSELACVRGVVCPVMTANLHLAARLADDSVVVGQHLLTGKEVEPLKSKIEQLWLTESLDGNEPVAAVISDAMHDRIVGADLICYPIGSFYSSVVANLLPYGVGKSVAANNCPKVFIPNPTHDPELVGFSVADQVALLQKYLIASGSPDKASALGVVLVDSMGGEYPGGFDRKTVEKLGVQVIDCSLVTESSSPFFDDERLAQALLALVDLGQANCDL